MRHDHRDGQPVQEDSASNGILSSKWLAWRDVHPSSRKIFIVGTGRSGTHMLARLLMAHPSVSGTVEHGVIFRAAARVAVQPQLAKYLLPGLLVLYRLQHARIAPRHYVDKSHPAIWFAETLADAFPRALFIGIQRNPFAVVASMLKHKGVLKWQERWRDYPVPNRFLGISMANYMQYDQMSSAAKCALRWKAHASRMRELAQILGDRLLVVDYDELVQDPDSRLKQLKQFLHLPTSLDASLIRGTSLDKWKQELTDDVKHDVETVIEEDCSSQIRTGLR